MKPLDLVELFGAIALTVVIVFRGLTLGVVVLAFLLKLFEALDGQNEVLLSVLKVFHALVRQCEVVVELGEFFALELVDVIFIVKGRSLRDLSVLVLLLSLLLLLNELSFPHLEHSLKELASPLEFLLLSKVYSNPLYDARILLFDAHVEATEHFLLLLE